MFSWLPFQKVLFGTKEKGSGSAPVSKMRITLDPPLRGITVLDSSNVNPIRFTAFLEHEEQKDSCKVALWHSSDGNNWTESVFEPVENTDRAVHIHDKGKTASSNVKVFTLDLPNEASTPLRFTLKYQLSEGEAWSWSGQGEGEDDGCLIFRTSKLNTEPSVEAQELFSNINPSIAIKKVSSDVDFVSVWDATVAAQASKLEDIMFGFPNQLERFFALRFDHYPWMGPEHGRGKFNVSNRAYLVSFIRSDGLNVVMLPFSGLEDCTAYLESDDDGNVLIHGRNDGANEATFRCIISVGEDFQRTVDAAFYRAKSVLYHALDIKEETEEDKSVSSSRPDRWIDGLGFCTWNSIGAQLTEEKIVKTLTDLETTGVKVSTLIIDDNWQSIKNRKWCHFEADKNGFPNGLKGLTQKIRSTFPYIKNIAVWHTLFGYWGGIDPEGEIAQKYKCVELGRGDPVYVKGHNDFETAARWAPLVVDASDIGRLYADFYQFLSDSGISCVKCDGQNYLDEIPGAEDRARLTNAYEDALKASGTKHFGHRIIYCMAHVPYVMMGYLLLRDRRSVLFRNSDDYFPHRPESHTRHVFGNAFNAVYTSHLNALPDWDMFQSDVGKDLFEGESHGALHAVARCISGGPVYVTDFHGRHDESVLSQLVAPSPAGYSVNLRPSTVALPSNHYSGYYDKKLLRINNFYGAGREGTSLMAVLNVSKQPLTEMLRFNEFRGSYPEVEYLVRAHRSGDVFGGKARDDNLPVVFSLQEVGWEFFSAVPLQTLPAETQSSTKICTFGLLGQISGACAVTKTDFKVQKSGRLTYEVELKAMGTLGIWFSDLQNITLDDILVCIDDKTVPESDIKIGKLLEIDVVSAWATLNKDEVYYSASGPESIAVQVTFKY